MTKGFKEELEMNWMAYCEENGKNPIENFMEFVEFANQLKEQRSKKCKELMEGILALNGMTMQVEWNDEMFEIIDDALYSIGGAFVKVFKGEENNDKKA